MRIRVLGAVALTLALSTTLSTTLIGAAPTTAPAASPPGGAATTPARAAVDAGEAALQRVLREVVRRGAVGVTAQVVDHGDVWSAAPGAGRLDPRPDDLSVLVADATTPRLLLRAVGKRRTDREPVTAVRSPEPLVEPGQGYGYSNTGCVLAGMMLRPSTDAVAASTDRAMVAPWT